nr:major head protein [Microvirus sp.]CAI9752261.1 major head protein [Microvirus sp.]
MNQVKGTGASSTLFQHDRPNKPQVSRFDLSRKVNFSLDTGMIVPIELLETYPGDKFRIGHKMALDTLPLVAPSLTNYKIVTHFYYMKKRDMWRGWKTFSTKGRSSRKVNFSLDTGMIVPIELLETYPGDKFRIGHKMALDTLPLVAPSLTNYKIVTHFYYMKKRDMWRGWKTFSTKGRSGNVNNFSLDTGMIVPIELLETYPGDKFRIGHKMALDTLPLVAPSLTNYKIVTHFYYMKKRDMWRGWKTFSTKGRSGNVKLLVPQVDLTMPINTASMLLRVPSGDSVLQQTGDVYPVSNHSLSSFLGVPPDKNGIYGFASNSSSVTHIVKNYVPYSFTVFNGSSSQMNASQRDAYNKAVSTGFNVFKCVSALPFVMYQSICKNFYVNPNLLQDNHALFPVEGDDEWLLPYTIANHVANYISGKSRLTSEGKINYDGVYSNNETDVDLRLLRYAMFDDDYFTTALKDLQRGDLTSLSMDASSSSIESVISGSDMLSAQATLDGDTSASSYLSFVDGVAKSGSLSDSNANGEIATPASRIASVLSVSSSLKKLQVAMTANQLRSLVAMSVWQERNMRVDGSYNKMIYQHFAVNPRSEEHVPVYIGGTVDYLNFSTVIQNSESSKSSPLGSTAGFGSSGGEGSVCSDFYCPDHGYIMGVMIIKPETIYQQGVDKLLTEITFDDFAQPEFQGLSPEGILNKEIYVSGNDKDNELFAYQERYTYLKVRQNVNRGLMQCKPDKDLLFSAYTQARWFESVPKFSYQFLCMSPDNLRRDWLAYPSYPAFRCQLLNEVFVTRKLSYTSEPNTFGF